jgi:hypothetical protein
MDTKRTRGRLLGALGVLVATVSSGQGQSNNSATARLYAQTSVQQIVSEPAGASRCQFCHPSQVEGYARSAMAHSLRRAAQEPAGTVDTPEEKIMMYSSPAGYWQRLESGGDVTNYRIDYVIGSGNHASGYLLDLAGHLFQSPVAYYTSRHTYDLAPGYEGVPRLSSQTLLHGPLSYTPGRRTTITVIVYSKGRNLDYSRAGTLASALWRLRGSSSLGAVEREKHGPDLMMGHG